MGKTPDGWCEVFQLKVCVMTDGDTSPAGSLPFQCQTKPLRRILVVEDDRDIRRINAVVLHRAGYHVDTVENGLAGWQAIQAGRHAPASYDLLITDHDMPGFTGLALVKKLRAAHMALPIIMATGKLPMEDLMSRYIWLQPAITLIKPYSVKALLKTVEAVLRTITPLPKSKPVAAIAFQL
jgi:DNA-binding response OmpR family regulator